MEIVGGYVCLSLTKAINADILLCECCMHEIIKFDVLGRSCKMLLPIKLLVDLKNDHQLFSTLSDSITLNNVENFQKVILFILCVFFPIYMYYRIYILYNL